MNSFWRAFLQSLTLTESQKRTLNPIFRTGDLVLLITLVGSLFAALLFAVHHIGFNQLQEMGFGVFLMPTPGLSMVLIHCVYVVVQAGVEIFLARQLGLAALDDMRDLMQAIVNSTTQIQDLTNEIDKISLQTNLLALNAAAEASRAGEFGTGFSVVASEVRTLAQRSAAAANQIKDLVAQNVEQAKNGLQLSNDTSVQINNIEEQAQQIRNLLTNMSDAAGKQAQWLDSINNTMQRVTQVSEHNTAQAQDTSDAIDNVDDLSGQLQSIVKRFMLRGNLIKAIN